MRPMNALLGAWIAVLTLAQQATAQECQGLRDRILQREPIVLGANPKARPFSYFENGVAQGYVVDLCKHALRRGAEVNDLPEPEFSAVTVKEIGSQFAALSDNRIDLACTPTTHSVERRRTQDVAFSLTVFLTGAAFLTHKKVPISELGDLDKGDVSARKNTTTLAGLEAAIKSTGAGERITLHPVDTHEKGINLLVNGVTDAHVGDQAILLPYLQVNPGLRLGEKLNSFEPYAIALRRCDTEGLDLLDEGLSRLFRSGEVWDIYKAHFRDAEPGALLIATFILGGLPN